MAAQCDSVGHLKPGTISDVIAHPPTCSPPSRTSGLRPAFARSVAATKPLTPAPITTMSTIGESFYVLRSAFYVLRSTFRRSTLRANHGCQLKSIAALGTTRAFAARMIARKFQDLEAWQLANALKLEVYKLIKSDPARSDHEYCRQIRKSAASSPRNIAEGFGRFRPRPFAQYMEFSIGSTQETHDALLDGVDRSYFTAPKIATALKLADRCLQGIHKASPVPEKLQRGRVAIPSALRERRTTNDERRTTNVERHHFLENS